MALIQWAILMISISRCSFCDKYNEINTEINRNITRLSLLEKKEIFFNSQLVIEKDAHKAISSDLFISKVCLKIVESLLSSHDSSRVGPPESLFTFRKKLKSYAKTENINLKENKEFEQFNKIYHEQFKKFKRWDLLTDNILAQGSFQNEAEKTFLSCYIKSVNVEYFFLQQQLKHHIISQLTLQKKKERIHKYGEFGDPVSLSLLEKKSLFHSVLFSKK